MAPLFCLIAVLMMFCGQASLAQEAILDLNTVVDVRKDGAVEVYQKFNIRSERNVFVNGLVYNFPLNIESPNGGRVQRTISNMQVTRDQSPEPFTFDEFGNSAELRSGGDKDLKPGEYAYEIRYVARRQILFRDGEDELVFPVVPYDWTIPVQNAGIEIHLPGQRAATRVFAATGKKDSRAGSVVLRRQGSTVRVQNSRPLPPGNGMLVSVSWVSGVVDRPTKREQAIILFKRYEHLLAAALGIAGLFGLSVLARLVGSRGGKKIRLQPPKGYSSATAQFYQDGVVGFKGVANTIIGLAAKGYLTIEETDPGEFMLQRTWRESDLGLSSVERAVAVAFYQNRPTRFQINSQHMAELLAARRGLETAVVQEFERTHQSSHFIWLGLIGLVPIIATIAMVALSPSSIWLLVLPLLILAGCMIMYWSALPSDPQWQTGIGDRSFADLFNTWITTRHGQTGLAVLVLGFVLTAWRLGSLEAIVTVLLGMVALWTYHGTKRPVSLGGKVQKTFETLRSAMSAAADVDPNSEMPVSQYELLLPYAAAWKCHSEWAEHFRKTNNSAGVPNVRPRWLTTPRTMQEPEQIADLLVSGLTQNIERAVSSFR
jgi:Predicted membrane protein (DUF2207)